MQNKTVHINTKHALPVTESAIVEIPAKWAARIGKGKMLIPSMAMVIAAVKKIPRGKLATVHILRNHLAFLYQVKMACPFTTGMILYLAAHEAELRRSKGTKPGLPYWRVIKEDGSLNPKFPGGLKNQAAHLRKEGFVIVKGKKDHSLRVKEYDTNLVSMDELQVYAVAADAPAYIEDNEY